MRAVYTSLCCPLFNLIYFVRGTCEYSRDRNLTTVVTAHCCSPPLFSHCSYSESIKYVPLNLDKLAAAIKVGKLDPSFPINTRHLWKAGVVTGSFKSIGRDAWGVKLLSKGAEQWNIPIKLEVQRASRSAIAAIEAAGGTIECKYYNKLGLRALLLPEKFSNGIPRLPMPKPRMRRWYEDPDNRGILPPTIEEQTPTNEQ